MPAARRLPRPWLIVLVAAAVASVGVAIGLHVWADSLLPPEGAVRYTSAPPPAIDFFEATNIASTAALVAAALVLAAAVAALVVAVRVIVRARHP